MRTSLGVILFAGMLVALGCNNSTSPPTVNIKGGNSPSVDAGPGAMPDTNESTDSSGALAASKIEFIGTKNKGRHEGGFKVFTVALEPKEGDITKRKATVEIDINSMWTDAAKLTDHLKSKDFFEVKTYPKATFVSTSIQPNPSGDATHTITGDLTMHGKTKSISFPAKVTIVGDSVNVKSEFKINRQDYGISYGPGIVHDDVTIKLDVNAPYK